MSGFTDWYARKPWWTKAGYTVAGYAVFTVAANAFAMLLVVLVISLMK